MKKKLGKIENLIFHDFHDISRFSMVSLSNLLRETIGNLEISWKITKNNNSRFFRDFFVFQKKSFEKIFLPISIRNLLRNPKIILRKSCGEFKDPYQKKVKFFYNVYSIFDILMYMLSITTLKSFTTVVRPVRGGWCQWRPSTHA